MWRGKYHVGELFIDKVTVRGRPIKIWAEYMKVLECKDNIAVYASPSLHSDETVMSKWLLTF